jgi:hypothetical protein
MKLVVPTRRNGFWILRRRVPLRYAAFDGRKIVRISTHIRIADDPKAIRAAPIVQQINRDLEAEWLALAAGEKPRERQRYDEADLLGRVNGHPSGTADGLHDPLRRRFRMYGFCLISTP